MTTRSSTSVCLSFVDPWFLGRTSEAQAAVAKKVASLIEMSLARNQSAAPGFETLKLPARSENVGREVGHIAQRPCQQRRHDFFGNAWRPVFTGDVPGTGDRERAAPGPRIDTKTGRWKVAAQLVKVEDDAQQYCDRNRT